MADDEKRGKQEPRLTAEDILMRRTPQATSDKSKTLYTPDVRPTIHGTSTAMRLTPEGQKYFAELAARKKQAEMQTARIAEADRMPSRALSDDERLSPTQRQRLRSAITKNFNQAAGKGYDSIKPAQQGRGKDEERDL